MTLKTKAQRGSRGVDQQSVPGREGLVLHPLGSRLPRLTNVEDLTQTSRRYRSDAKDEQLGHNIPGDPIEAEQHAKAVDRIPPPTPASAD